MTSVAVLELRLAHRAATLRRIADAAAIAGLSGAAATILFHTGAWALRSLAGAA